MDMSTIIEGAVYDTATAVFVCAPRAWPPATPRPAKE